MQLASQSAYGIIVYFLANYRPHLSNFLENVIFRDPSLVTFYSSFLSMWFQAAECNAINASLLLNLINSNFCFLTENLPILNPYLPQKSQNLRPHSSKSIENATLACVESVSNRVIARRLERKQKKCWNDSVIFFFLLLSQLSRRTSRGKACYAS